ncbi:hypothetical protein K432DRAFT_406755 [Lepidopterella palustris CBS 459.81]|uniref:Uncharacterized protein n=1 Tax=Lepidopterella palustris CBS 459.81 TaxID=1314670 RepID=A0A8E2JD74_9PEZI|nr:hypothetical protein K432DRAFT_406755 [Lepidopterella palustris CBS 459.81]
MSDTPPIPGYVPKANGEESGEQPINSHPSRPQGSAGDAPCRTSRLHERLDLDNDLTPPVPTPPKMHEQNAASQSWVNSRLGSRRTPMSEARTDTNNHQDEQCSQTCDKGMPPCPGPPPDRPLPSPVPSMWARGALPASGASEQLPRTISHPGPFDNFSETIRDALLTEGEGGSGAEVEDNSGTEVEDRPGRDIIGNHDDSAGDLSRHRILDREKISSKRWRRIEIIVPGVALICLILIVVLVTVLKPWVKRGQPDAPVLMFVTSSMMPTVSLLSSAPSVYEPDNSSSKFLANQSQKITTCRNTTAQSTTVQGTIVQSTALQNAAAQSAATQTTHSALLSPGSIVATTAQSTSTARWSTVSTSSGKSTPTTAFTSPNTSEAFTLAPTLQSAIAAKSSASKASTSSWGVSPPCTNNKIDTADMIFLDEVVSSSILDCLQPATDQNLIFDPVACVEKAVGIVLDYTLCNTHHSTQNIVPNERITDISNLGKTSKHKALVASIALVKMMIDGGILPAMPPTPDPNTCEHWKCARVNYFNSSSGDGWWTTCGSRDNQWTFQDSGSCTASIWNNWKEFVLEELHNPAPRPRLISPHAPSRLCPRSVHESNCLMPPPWRAPYPELPYTLCAPEGGPYFRLVDAVRGASHFCNLLVKEKTVFPVGNSTQLLRSDIAGYTTGAHFDLLFAIQGDQRACTEQWSVDFEKLGHERCMDMFLSAVHQCPRLDFYGRLLRQGGSHYEMCMQWHVGPVQNGKVWLGGV